MVKLTKRGIDAFKAEGSTTSILWDEQLPGFGVKALSSGTKRFVLKYRAGGGGRNAKQRWMTLGTYGAITLDQGRDLARQALAEIARGGDPQGTKYKLRAAPTLQDVWDRFETEHLSRKKAITQRDYKAAWKDLIAPRLGTTKIEAMTRDDVGRFHKAMSATPYRANRVLALLSRLMSLAEAWDWRVQGTNPCKHVPRYEETARTRPLTEQELRRLGPALTKLRTEGTLTTTAANAIELLLLTGARLNEVLTARWAWVDLRSGLLKLPDSKTGAKPLYLSRAAKAVLKRQKAAAGNSKLIFPSHADPKKPFVNLRKSWLRVCAEAKIEGARLHDLRHTAASIAVSQGASLPIIGRLLGHSQAQTTQRYAHVDSSVAIKAADEIGTFVSASFGAAAKRKSPKRPSKDRASYVTITP
jgi:integrase